MTKFYILVNGYAYYENKILHVSPTTVLLEENGLFILVDPGSNQEMLTKQLYKMGFNTDSIDRIFLTHYHLDHILNIRLFPNATICDGYAMWCSDGIYPYSRLLPDTSIRVIPTPGHSVEHASLLFKHDMGIIAVAGDIIWWENGAKHDTSRKAILEKKDPYAVDISTLRQSRSTLLDMADYIIPGHGMIFKVQS